MADVTEGHRPGWKLGSIVGVPVFLARSWLIIAVVIVAMFGPQLSYLRPDLGPLAYALAGVYALALLLSVLVHEVAHAVSAKAMRMRPQHIVLDLFGGHTQFHADNIRPLSSFVVAFAGPLSNLAIAGLAWVALGSMDPYDVMTRLVYGVMWTNGFVGLFNLLPGLPLDGGAMLEAAIWGATGRRSQGTIVAAYLGMLAAVGVVVFFLRGLLTGDPPGLFTVVWSLVIGQMLWSASRNALQIGRIRRRAEGVDIQGLTHPVRLVGPGDRVGALLNQGGAGQPLVVVDPATGHPIGLVDGGALANAFQSGRYDATAISVSRGITDADLVDHGSDAITILTRLSGQPRDALLVMNHGRVVGLLPTERLLAQLG